MNKLILYWEGFMDVASPGINEHSNTLMERFIGLASTGLIKEIKQLLL